MYSIIIYILLSIIFPNSLKYIRFILALSLTVGSTLSWCSSSGINEAIQEEEKVHLNLFHAHASGRQQRHQLIVRNPDSVKSNLTSVQQKNYLVRIVSDSVVNQHAT